MGWKISMIIIENPDNFTDDFTLLKALGKDNFQFVENTTFEKAIDTKDKSISIGYCNGNIIVNDNFQITEKSLEKAKNLNLTKEEQNLYQLFPTSEIITVACHSITNYHAYSIINNGKKIRWKLIASDTSLVEFGQRTVEEEKIYTENYQKIPEDQLMEEFTFEMINKRLDFFINTLEAKAFMQMKTFKKYKNSKKGFLKKIFKNK
jgi:hypothetical protein